MKFLLTLIAITFSTFAFGMDCQGEFKTAANLGNIADQTLTSSLNTYKMAKEDFQNSKYDDSLEAAKVADILANKAQNLFFKTRDLLSPLVYCGSPIADQSMKLTQYVDDRLEKMDTYFSALENLIKNLEILVNSKDLVLAEDVHFQSEDKNAVCYGTTRCANGFVATCETYGQGCTWFVTNNGVACTGFNQYGQWVRVFGRCW